MKTHRILVLEDDRTSRQIISRALEKAGYDVIQCSEGKDALRMAARYVPIAVIADVMLPDITGTEVVEQLMRSPDCKDMKYIFLTGILSKKASKPDSKYRFEVDGIQHRALAKPVRKSLLLKMIREIVQEREAELKALEEASFF